MTTVKHVLADGSFMSATKWHLAYTPLLYTLTKNTLALCCLTYSMKELERRCFSQKNTVTGKILTDQDLREFLFSPSNLISGRLFVRVTVLDK